MDDGTTLDRAVGTLHTLAAEARLLAASVRAAAAADWSSQAAERFRQRLAQEAALADRCADGVDEAARALAVHARAVRGWRP